MSNDIKENPTKEELDKVINQKGGTRLIQYGEIILYAPISEIKNAISALSSENKTEREEIMQSVNDCLKLSVPAIMMPNPDYELIKYVMEDIVIWFANEIFEGREQLEKTVH